MLQQTRVVAVLEHYASFLKKFPDIRSLASAREHDVLAAWSGLGYYRRARALHRAAKQVVTDNAGRLPGSAAALMELPGIGRYTANAIASIAYGEPVPVVDGNVDRVLTRFTGRQLSQAELWTLAGELLDRKWPGDFNQSVMEFGATLCTPQNPKCEECPVRSLCATRGKVAASKSSQMITRVEVDYVLACTPKRVYLVQRAETESLMPSMWELPQDRASGKVIARLGHSITNRRYLVNVRHAESPPKHGRWVPISKVQHLPLTGLTRKILRKYLAGVFI